MNSHMPGRAKHTTKRTKLFMLAAIAAVAMALAAPALAAADWGAIAVSPHTGKIGVGYDFPSAAGAKHRAINQCHQLGCRAAVWVQNGYAALVLKRDGVFVAGVGRTKNLAFATARERAHEPTAKRYAWVFSG
jgi:hypothetical protein